MRGFWLLLLLLTAHGVAQEPTQPPAEQPAESTSTDPATADPNDPANLPVPTLEDATKERFNSSDVFFDTIGKLFIIIGIMLILGFLAKKFLPGRLGGATGDNLKLIQSLPLGTRRFVSLIEADGKRLLIGVTDNEISLIKDMDKPDFVGAFEEVEEPKRVREMWEEQA